MKVTPVQSAALILGGTGLFAAWETARGNPKFYSNVLMPALHRVVPAETAHILSIKLLGCSFIPRSKYTDPDCLHTKVWQREFKNPIGIAAGFDKHAEAMVGLEKVGFGFIEVGSITPLPQAGNSLPRVFRLKEDSAIINRYGFNSHGHDKALSRLSNWRDQHRSVILGINLGKNKTSEDHLEDYSLGVMKLGSLADYIVINVSSPNTKGLRQLQKKSTLRALACKIREERDELPVTPRPAVLIKLSPDLQQSDINDIAEMSLDKRYGIDGLIISNTTVDRSDSLQSKHRTEIGGLSGLPLKQKSTELIRQFYTLTDGKVPIVGVGGVANGQDAYEKIRAGASLVQLYTALVYHGPPVITKIKEELVDLLARDGFNSVREAVGADVDSMPK